MEVIGRITANAQRKELTDGREVVNFSIAINDSYKPKGGERVKATTYCNCSYWISTKIAEHLTRGSIIQLYGHIGINIYSSMGEAKGNLTFHVNNIKIIMKYKAGQRIEESALEQRENLPF